MFRWYYQKVVGLLMLLVPGPSDYDSFSVASLAGRSLAYAHSAVTFPFSALCLPPLAPQLLFFAIFVVPTFVAAGYVEVAAAAAVVMIEGRHESNVDSAAMVVVVVGGGAIPDLPSKGTAVDYGPAMLAVVASMAVAFVADHVSNAAHLLATSPVAVVPYGFAVDHPATNVAAGPSVLQEEP